ncbi:MAG: hypothetical protein ACR2QK_19870, partial [Acidimicrobiales bacterium]
GWTGVTSSIVLFLDGDDMLDPEAMARVVEALADEPKAGRCQFRLRLVDGEGAAIAGGFPEPGRPLPAGDLRDRMASNPDDIAWQPTSGNAFRSTVLRRLLPMPEEPYRISADHYLSNLSALHGRVAAIETELGSYRIHGDNADHRSGFDLGRARDILVRTDETHRLLLDHGTRVGSAMPDSVDGFTSLTTAGLRLASFRISGRAEARAAVDRAHPYPEDRRWSLTRKGLTAARGRTDFSPPRRVAAGAWIALLAVAPRRLVPKIAASALTR